MYPFLNGLQLSSDRPVPPDVTYMLYTCQYSCQRVIRLLLRLVCVVQHITDIVTSHNTDDTMCE